MFEGDTCPNMFKGDLAQTCPSKYVIAILVTVHCFKQHFAWIIAINSYYRLPNDVMSRQGLIEKSKRYVPKHPQGGGTWLNLFEGGTCPTMFKGMVLPKHALVYMSSLFLVTLHNFKPHFAWVIAINSNSRLPNDVMSKQSFINRWGVRHRY